jgi:fatty-acyl-CoA synthase
LSDAAAPTAPPKIDAPPLIGAQIEARARHPEVADRIFLRAHARAWTYRQYRDECVRYAHFLLHRLGPAAEDRPGHVAMLLENHLELLALYGGCAYAGLTLFGVNTGLRGDTLAGVVDQSRARLLVVDERLLADVGRVLDRLAHVAPENVLVLPTEGGRGLGERDLLGAIAAEVGGSGARLDAPDVPIDPGRNLMTIYTSGTTGLPKGIINSHVKFFLIGKGVSGNLGLGPEDCGYACMPLFHSNALFLGFHPALEACASIAIRERFSASSFVPDVLEHGVTYWNYVGEPVHYVLAALERQYGGDEERILAEVARHPRNHLRYAVGNGAAPPDIDRFSRWLALEDMFELYGSTEAAISTFRKKTDPRGSVGEITDPNVRILDSSGRECPPADVGADGKIRNYEEAVGEICRVAADAGLFQGYYGNLEASASKFRSGVYHSGDLGHVMEHDGRRFLYFDGRTDDWIRKDGENFSAAQVGRLLQEAPDVALAAAYGVPCEVSDELVMAALKLRPGASFDPRALFEYCDQQVREGGMDRKWLPDFVRIVDDFEFTQTQKILVRRLKADHFDRRRLPDALLYWRERGDRTFKPFTKDDYEALRSRFEAAERLPLLERA